MHTIRLVAAAAALTLASVGAVRAQTAQPVEPTTAAETARVSVQKPDLRAPRVSNKWRVQFDESSKSDGTLLFRVWKDGVTPVDVPVAVPDNQGENAIARATRDAFRSVLGNGYKAEIDDGEDVLLKKSGSTENFSVALVSSTVKDVDISIGRE